MDYSEIIGFIAGGLVAISFLPQVLKSWKTKSTKDIATSLTIINIIGQILWILNKQYFLNLNEFFCLNNDDIVVNSKN